LSGHEVPLELDAHYSALQNGWEVEERADLGKLVVPNGNGSAPVHRWFRMKEAFSCELLPTVAAETRLTDKRTITVCDPFTGSGTTAISLAQMVAGGKYESAAFLGVESNPFLQLVASVKLRALQAPPAEFTRVAQHVGAMALRGKVNPIPAPSLTTFANPEYFEPETLRELLTLRAAIDKEAAAGSDPLAVDMARVCLGAIVESCSSLRRDGRALRYEAGKVAARPVAAFLARAEKTEADLPTTGVNLSGAVLLADARHEFALSDPPLKADLFIFSPPYPNNIDYTEVYKLEAWLLGLYDDASGFAAQRRSTIRSHASLDFGEQPLSMSRRDQQYIDDLLAPLLATVPEAGRYAAGRRRTIRGYAYDLFQTLRNLTLIAADDAKLVYVVGNSLHGGHDDRPVLIAADVLIARLAERAGFTIEKLAVARYPSRRRSRSRFLRESVVFARRDAGRVE
jgi:hypothetical protein